MAENSNRKHAYHIKDLIKDGRVKGRTVSKSKLGYFTWLRRGGWKKVSSIFGGLLLFGYVAYEIRTNKRTDNYVEAKRLIEQQGVVPIEAVNTNLFKSREESQFGQSHLKDDKLN